MSSTGVTNTTASEWISVKEGRIGRRIQPAQGPAYDLPGCCPCPTFVVDTSGIPASEYDWAYAISWTPIEGATYTVSLDSVDPYIVTYTSATTAIIDYVWDYTAYPNGINLVITENGRCPVTSKTLLFPCFLAGSMVQMADGSQKAIEDVVVGDQVLGAFGEVNPVLALHRPLLGTAHMNRINGEHSTTAHHPHVSVDRGFYCSEPATVEQATYGHEHDVMDGSGVVVKRMLYGLKKGRVQRLDLGIVLKTVEGGRPVTSLETYEMPPETQLYNLVTGGSHTYHVDGYAVTGWPREDDWDYDTWTPIVEECQA